MGQMDQEKPQVYLNSVKASHPQLQGGRAAASKAGSLPIGVVPWGGERMPDALPSLPLALGGAKVSISSWNLWALPQNKHILRV